MWMLGTRCRPERAQRALDDFAAHGSTPGVLYVHAMSKDEERGYEDIRLPAGWVKVVGTGYMAEQCRTVQAMAPDAQWYGMLADDNHPATPDFDLAMIEAAVPMSFVCCNGGPKAKTWPGSIPGVMMWGRGLIDAVGWWAPPGIVHATLDEHWKQIYKAAGVGRYLPDVVVTHDHWKHKARPKDFTDTEPRRHWGPDLAALHAFVAKDLADAVQRIKEASHGRAA
jgi:hypothetical protein